MNDQLPDPAAFMGPIGRGKAPLPADASADQCAAVLVDEDQFRTRRPGHAELHHLAHGP